MRSDMVVSLLRQYSLDADRHVVDAGSTGGGVTSGAETVEPMLALPSPGLPPSLHLFIYTAMSDAPAAERFTGSVVLGNPCNRVICSCHCDCPVSRNQ